MSSSSMQSNGSTSSSVRPLTRSESMAYPPANTSTVLSRLQFYCRQHTRAVLATAAFVVVLLVITAPGLAQAVPTGVKQRLRGRSSQADVHWGGAIHRGYFNPSDAVIVSTDSSSSEKQEFHFAAVTDLDELSRVKDSKKPKFYSTFLPGTLTFNTKTNRYTIGINKDKARTLVTGHNEAGRGAEFSELTIYNNRLLTFDDRTGDVFEILNNEKGKDSFVVPRFVITEGNGETDKGMKWEWSTVKDGELIMGSMGKEYTRQDGSIKNRNNLWVGILNNRGELRREDWTDKYQVVRKALKAELPGYIIIEALNWSPSMKKWVFLPRRISSEAYDENKDEKMGGHQLVMVDDSGENPQVVEIKMDSLDPLKGFSTFAFVPNTGDRHALAIRSVEENCVDFTPECQQRSYFIVFDVVTGEVLSDEIEYPDKVKFEGVEFVDMFAVPPKNE